MKPYEIRRYKPKGYEMPRKKQYYYVQIGANGEVMNTSEMYTTKSAAKRGVIDAVNRVFSYIGNDLYQYIMWSILATDKTKAK